MKLTDIENLEKWTEITHGLYRYVTAACVCYEIHVIKQNHKQDILDAEANLYLTGDWFEVGTNVSYFSREYLNEGQPMNVKQCLSLAQFDYDTNMEG